MKYLKSFQLLLVLVLILAACGGGGDDKDSSDDAESDQSPVGDPTSGEVVRLASMDNRQVREIAVSPNGESFVIATESTLTQVSLVDDGETSVDLDRMRSLAISSDGNLVVGYSEGNRHVMLWNVEAGTTLGLEGLAAAVNVSISPDDAYIVGVAIDEPTVLAMWSAETGDLLWSIEGTESASDIDGASAAFSPDSQEIVVGLYDGSLSLRDVVTGEVVQRFAGHTTDALHTHIVSVAYAPDGSSVTSVGDDNQVRVWNAETGAARYVIAGFEGTVAYTPDSQWIIVMRITRGNSARTWSLATGQLGQVFDGPVQLMPNGLRVYGGKRQAAVSIFDFESGHSLITFEEISANEINVPLPDSETMISTYWLEPVIYQWDVDSATVIKRWEWQMDDSAAVTDG